VNFYYYLASSKAGSSLNNSISHSGDISNISSLQSLAQLLGGWLGRVESLVEVGRSGGVGSLADVGWSGGVGSVSSWLY